MPIVEAEVKNVVRLVIHNRDTFRGCYDGGDDWEIDVISDTYVEAIRMAAMHQRIVEVSPDRVHAGISAVIIWTSPVPEKQRFELLLDKDEDYVCMAYPQPSLPSTVTEQGMSLSRSEKVWDDVRAHPEYAKAVERQKAKKRREADRERKAETRHELAELKRLQEKHGGKKR